MGLINGFDWHQVDDVLLDMDGTLLDRHFDNFFFEEYFLAGTRRSIGWTRLRHERNCSRSIGPSKGN